MIMIIEYVSAVVGVYLGRGLDKPVLFFPGGDYRYNTHGLLLIVLLITDIKQKSAQSAVDAQSDKLPEKTVSKILHNISHSVCLCVSLTCSVFWQSSTRPSMRKYFASASSS